MMPFGKGLLNGAAGVSPLSSVVTQGVVMVFTGEL